MKRQYYIDNLRWIWIFMLIPFHTAMAFNTWEEPNYIFLGGNKAACSIVLVICSFYMPLLFVLAGMSMNFALRKRSYGQFFMERMKKLLLPLITGLFTVVAYMAYTADRFHNGYSGGFFSHYKIFFTQLSNFTGYDGKFTPAHLWFMLFLFIVSLLFLLVVAVQRKYFKNISFKNLKVWQIILLYIFPFLFSFILDFGGKSIGESFALVALGYYVFSNNEIIEKLQKHKYVFLLITVIASLIKTIVCVWIGDHYSPICTVCDHISEWFGILASLGLGKSLLNWTNPLSKYMTARSFPIYIFHFVWIVFIQYNLYKITSSAFILYFVTVIGALVLTIITVEIVQRIPILRTLFGIKGAKNDRKNN